ncbi:MAG: hypothetical protein J6T25_02990 [Bacilli bacterium]|nr:hypothetical protein [Bacilli bacterium]
MAKRKKETKLPFDKTNEIKPLVAYFAIVNQGNANAVIEIFRRAGSTASFVQMGTGTASKRVMDILGIEDNRKEIVVSIIREEKLNEAKTELEAYYAASKRNKGIGFSISLTGLSGVRVYQFLANL